MPEKGGWGDRNLRPIENFPLIMWHKSCYGSLLEVPLLLRENSVYKMCIERRQRENIVFKIGEFEIPEHTFVDCFKRETKGFMPPSIFELCATCSHSSTLIQSSSLYLLCKYLSKKQLWYRVPTKKNLSGFFNFVILYLQFLSIVAC